MTIFKPHFRPDTNDEHIWDNIVKHNEYRLPDDLSNYMVLDVGAHIGAFSYACATRNAKKIWAYEPDPESVELWWDNMEEFKNRAFVFKMAVFNPVIRASTLMLSKQEDIAGRINSGSRSLLKNEGEFAVSLTSFDEIIEQIVYESGGKSKLLVKLDCEGSEWPILFNSNRINLIHEFVGEWHSFELNKPVKRKTLYTVGDLIALFEKKGFLIDATSHDTENTMGMFFAKRGKWKG